MSGFRRTIFRFRWGRPLIAVLVISCATSVAPKVLPTSAPAPTVASLPTPAPEGLAREPAAGGERANDNRPESAARRGLSDPFTTRADRFGGLLHLDVGFLAQVISQEVMPEDGAHSSRYSAAGSAAYRATIQRTDAYLVPDLEELLVT